MSTVCHIRRPKRSKQYVIFHGITLLYMDGLVSDCSVSSVYAMEIMQMQSCCKSSIKSIRDVLNLFQYLGSDTEQSLIVSTTNWFGKVILCQTLLWCGWLRTVHVLWYYYLHGHHQGHAILQPMPPLWLQFTHTHTHTHIYIYILSAAVLPV